MARTIKKWNAIIRDPLNKRGIELLSTVCTITDATEFEEKEFLNQLSDQHVLVTRTKTAVGNPIFLHARSLMIVGRASIGVDNIDLKEASARGIMVVNAPTNNALAVAEHTIGLLIALMRHIPQADSDLRRGVWGKNKYMGRQVSGKTLGIVGLGRIGQQVAKRATALGLKVQAFSRSTKTVDSISFVPKDELFATSDIITIHVPLTAETKHLVGKKEITLMSHKKALFINTSRGLVIDEEALIEGLHKGWLAGAALDVFTNEPLGDHPLTKLPNVILTPHIAGSTAESQEASGIEVAENILDALAGKMPETLVNREVFVKEIVCS